MDETDVRRVIRNRSFGFSKARFLPKENGLRLLANLKASSRISSEACEKQINSTKAVKFLYF
ncbi:hypothetical protein, partial [Streptomyces fildesensis]|uniref:hypothetical protein n=1 Tax=Streptomyces fildesensis TaxID=375757 RepID=UPI001E43659C